MSIVAVMGVMGAILAASASAGAAVRPVVTAHAASASQGISWGPCAEADLQQAGAQCGYVSVPLDYADPSGPQIQLAVSRIEHTSSDYQGVILTNPGGPGGEGLDLNTFLIPVLQQEGFGAAVADYDWIGFDPRGVGSSIPAISCEPDYFGPDRPNYVPYTPQLLDTWLSRSEGFAQACAAASPLQAELLRNMTTRDNALDLDSIRKALGQSQITYYGFSWGTDLGQVYATMFPTHLRRLILDSNVDPLRDGYQDFNLDQDIPFNRNEDIWFAWLAKYNSVYHLGSTESAVQNLFYATENQLAADPAGGVIGPDEWTDIFLEPAYYEETWVQWGQVFSDWVNEHNAAAANELIQLYQAVDAPGDDNEFAVYLSVLCTDSQWPTNWSTWQTDTWAIFSVAPLEAWGNTWFNAPCIYWPAPAQPRVAVGSDQVKSALLIDETLDAATPFEGSLVVRQLFPHSVLLAEPGGTSHADSLSGDLCVDGTIANYLETGALPARNPQALWDKTCAPLPQPIPPSSSDSAQGAQASAARALARMGRSAQPVSLPALKTG
ncbi:MAG: alpha/beta fold hydrolase [Solirubrobacteraceae bacterium]